MVETQEAALQTGWPHSLLNGSEMGRRIYELDWAVTPLGAIDTWPAALRAHVGMLVDNAFAQYIFWGPANIALYNDGYIPMAGEKHPRMLGSPTEVIWREVWEQIRPLLESAKRGEGVVLDDLLLYITRRGFAEEFYCTFSYSPLRDETGTIAGVLATITETTGRVLAHRRLETLRALASHANVAFTESDALTRIAAVLEDCADIAFARIYLAEEGAGTAHLAIGVGPQPTGLAAPEHLRMRDGQFTAALAGLRDATTLVLPIGDGEGRVSIGALLVRARPHLAVDEAYVEFLRLLASQIGNSVAGVRAFGQERIRAESANITRTIEQIGLFAESGQQLFWMTRPDGFVDWHNRSWYEYTGQTPDQALGLGWQAAHHPDDFSEVMRRWNDALQRRIPLEMTFRLRGKDGRFRWFLTRAVPELDDDGHVVRWYGSHTNIDAERRASQQQDFFASLGERLVQAADRESTLHALADGLVPQFADWTIVNLADASDNLILTLAQHRRPEQTRLLEPFIGSAYERSAEGNSSATQVYRSGKPLLHAGVDPSFAAARVKDELAEVVAQLGMRSAIVVPIVANGIIYGTFHAVRIDPENGFTESDVPFFAEIGRRMGFALQSVQAYEREARIAHAFQSAALPAALPSVPGMAFSALYEPASHEANVGGDFYDAFRLPDGRVVLSIGDVAGAGLGAAATMAALRQSIRAVASVNPNPEMLLKAADGIFSEERGAPFASAFVAVVDPVTFSIQYANAGHPAPRLRAPDGTLTKLEGDGLLLGIDTGSEHGARQVGRVAAEPGSLLLMYTDGLSEATRDPLAGEALLDEALVRADASDESLAGAARRIWHEVVRPQGRMHDDVAILVARLGLPLPEVSGAKVYHWSFACEDAAAAHAASAAVVAYLSECGADDDELFSAQVIFSELIGNVFRHACTMLDVVLDLTQDAAVLHVLDSGEGFSLNPKLPADAYAERGRGLFIVTRLAREFTVTPRTMSRGSHARAVLRGHIARVTALREAKV